MGSPVNIVLDKDKPSDTYIFDIKFECVVRYIDSLSENDIKNFGVFDTGIDEANDSNNTQRIKVLFSIAQMADHRAKGFFLAIAHPVDAVKIYEFTQNHLQVWANHISRGGLNGIKAPFDDLQKLDMFCSEIYEQAKFFDVQVVSSIERMFKGTSFSSIQNMFSAKPKEQDRIEELSARRRPGFSELFKEVSIKNNPAYKTQFGAGDLNGGPRI